MSKAPESFATRRLLLRRPVAADADAIFRRYASDPEVTRYMSWPTSRSLADTQAFLVLCDAEWATWSADGVPEPGHGRDPRCPEVRTGRRAS